MMTRDDRRNNLRTCINDRLVVAGLCILCMAAVFPIHYYHNGKIITASCIAIVCSLSSVPYRPVGYHYVCFGYIIVCVFSYICFSWLKLESSMKSLTADRRKPRWPLLALIPTEQHADVRSRENVRTRVYKWSSQYSRPLGACPLALP